MLSTPQAVTVTARHVFANQVIAPRNGSPAPRALGFSLFRCSLRLVHSQETRSCRGLLTETIVFVFLLVACVAAVSQQIGTQTSRAVRPSPTGACSGLTSLPTARSLRSPRLSTTAPVAGTSPGRRCSLWTVPAAAA